MSGRRFLLDQSTDARLLQHLRSLGHDAVRVGAEFPPGLPDRDVLDLARREGRILLTDDRDFGELVIRLGLPHAGVIYLRMGDEVSLETKQERLSYVLSHHDDDLGLFLVVTLSRVRIRAN